jgi:hypothetical protein
MSDSLKENDDNNDEDIVIVEDPNKLSVTQEDDDDDDGDERVASSNEDDERDAIRERRRQEKQDRKHRREEAIKRDKLELDFLRKRNDDLERRVSVQEQRTHNLDLSAFDAALNKAAQEADMAERVIAKAVAAGNGDDVAQAMRYRDQAFARIQQLNFQKQQVAQQRPQPQQIDDMTLRYAQEFISDNPWYDAQGRDEDSAIVIAIDQALAKDGYDPRTSEYWDELKKRASRRLPEKFGAEERPARRAEDKPEPKREPRGGPTVGSGREHAPTSTRKEIYISPERKQALIEAGVWDDPTLRARYVKRYAEYDRNGKS